MAPVLNYRSSPKNPRRRGLGSWWLLAISTATPIWLQGFRAATELSRDPQYALVAGAAVLTTVWAVAYVLHATRREGIRPRFAVLLIVLNLVALIFAGYELTSSVKALR